MPKDLTKRRDHGGRWDSMQLSVYWVDYDRRRKMKTDTDIFWEHFEQQKCLRPKCGGDTDTWEHSMITYESDGIKECDYCGYWEDIEVRYDAE